MGRGSETNRWKEAIKLTIGEVLKLEIITLYQELLKTVLEENKYLKENLEVDPDKITKFEMSKKVSRDKIEKFMNKNSPEIEGESKEMLKKIISYTIKVENDNVEQYKIKMGKSIENIGIVQNDVSLKKKYTAMSSMPEMYDKKK